MRLTTYLALIMLLAIAVGTTVILYWGILFGDDDGVVLIKTYTAAVIFGVTAIGSKILSSDYPTGPRRFSFVQSHGSASQLISYLGIVGLTALFGFLLYIDNSFIPTELDYSVLLYYSSHVLVGFITGVIVVSSWVISSKL